MAAEITPGERDPQEAEALKCLAEAEAYLHHARLNDSKNLYARALEYAERVLQYLPWSVFAHYICAVAHFRGSDDRDYANQKYRLLLTVESEEANSWAQKLKDELEGTQAPWKLKT
jgi:hypothetical protein